MTKRRQPWIAAALVSASVGLVALVVAACGDSTAAEDATGDASSRRGRAGGEWPMFRGDSSSTGVAQSDLPEQPALLIRDFKSQKTFIITRSDIIRMLT